VGCDSLALSDSPGREGIAIGCSYPRRSVQLPCAILAQARGRHDEGVGLKVALLDVGSSIAELGKVDEALAQVPYLGYPSEGM